MGVIFISHVENPQLKERKIKIIIHKCRSYRKKSQTGEGLLKKREYFKSIKRTKKEHYKENKFTFYKDENV